MRCLTLHEARAILARHIDSDGNPHRKDKEMKGGRFYFGSESLTNAYWVALRLMEALGPWEEAWLWLDTPDTWKRPGLHLYSKLRQSYGDLRLVHEAPVHQFYGFEEADLCSFITVGIINEWAFYLITSHDYGRLYISRSSGAELWVRDEGQLQRVVTALEEHGLVLSDEDASTTDVVS